MPVTWGRQTPHPFHPRVQVSECVRELGLRKGAGRIHLFCWWNKNGFTSHLCHPPGQGSELNKTLFSTGEGICVFYVTAEVLLFGTRRLGCTVPPALFRVGPGSAAPGECRRDACMPWPLEAPARSSWKHPAWLSEPLGWGKQKVSRLYKFSTKWVS